MRKALTLVVLAASTALSVPAFAQDIDQIEMRENSRAERREARAERQEVRAERQEARQEARQERAARVETSFDASAAVQRPDRGERREERREAREERREARRDRVAPLEPPRQWGGDPNDPARARIERRYERGGLENAWRYGTEQDRERVRDILREQRRDDRREWRQDDRDDRREWRQDRRDDRREWRQDNRDDRRDWRYDNRDDQREWRQDRRQDRRDWNRSWRNDRRYDWRSYRDYNRNLFRAPRYYAPRGWGWGYNRFSIGVILGSLLWDRNYWINDPWQYRLPPAPAGYVWVRYYNDVLLIDRFDGRVVDVIHDFFW
jgi:hypothetical protein